MGKGEYLGEFETIALLAVLRVGRHAHGAAVHREIFDTTGRDVSIPTVHVTLNRLADKGLLDCRVERQDGGGRARKTFRITEEGLRRLETTRVLMARIWDGVRLGPLGGETEA